MIDYAELTPRVRGLYDLAQRYTDSIDVAERTELAVEIANKLSPAEQRAVCVLADLFRDVRAVLRDPNRRHYRSRSHKESAS